MSISAAVGQFLTPAAKKELYRVRHLLTGKKEYWHYEDEERDTLLRRALFCLKFNRISGDYAEFGSQGGGTLPRAYRFMKAMGSDRHLWAFDSFQGLPASDIDKHPHWVAGTLATGLSDFLSIMDRERVPRTAVTTVEGFYSDTIGPDGRYDKALPGDIALAYIDCDMLSSTRDVLHFLRPRLKHGMIVALDDYFCYDATSLSGERAALIEFEASDPGFVFAPYQPFGWHGMSFIVEDARFAKTPERRKANESEALRGS